MLKFFSCERFKTFLLSSHHLRLFSSFFDPHNVFFFFPSFLGYLIASRLEAGSLLVYCFSIHQNGSPEFVSQLESEDPTVLPSSWLLLSCMDLFDIFFLLDLISSILLGMSYFLLMQRSDQQKLHWADKAIWAVQGSRSESCQLFLLFSILADYNSKFGSWTFE